MPLWHGVCVTVDVTADGGGVISAGFAAASTQHAVGGRAAVLAQQAFAPATRLAYAHDWAVFTEWAHGRGIDPLPADPATVCDYLADLAALTDPDGRHVYSVSTITRRVAAINAAHAAAGLQPPGRHPHVRAVLSGLRRTLGRERAVKQAAPLMLEDLRRVIAAMPLTWPAAATAARDSALLLLGFAGAYRRSELAQHRVADLTWVPEDGLHLRVRWSKTDQEAAGATKAIPFGTRPATCVPCHLHRWLRVLAATTRAEVMRAVLTVTVTDADARHTCRGPAPQLPDDTPLFPVMNRHGQPTTTPMSGQAVNAVVKRRLRCAGIDPARYSGHSLRAGFVTQALRAGAPVHEVMNQTLHRDPATVHIYARRTNPLDSNAVTRLGL